jgi:hypothetical protein
MFPFVLTRMEILLIKEGRLAIIVPWIVSVPLIAWPCFG